MSVGLPDPGATEDSAPLHVAVVTERYDRNGGGNEKSTAEIVERLVALGCRVTVLAGACQDGAGPNGATLERLKRKKSASVLRLLRFVWWAERRLRLLRPDVSLSMSTAVRCHVLQPRGGTVKETQTRNIAMRASASKRLEKRVLLWTRPKQVALRALERRALRWRGLRRVVAISGYVAEQLGSGYGLGEGRVTEVRNAAAMPRLAADDRRRLRERVRTGWRVPEGAVVFVFAAHNFALKGGNTLLPALRKVVDAAEVPVVLAVAGPYDQNVLRQVARLELRADVRFAGQTSQMPALYAAADVTVLPTFYDPASKVVLESLMLGVPAITTRFNGAADWITPGIGDVLEDPADADALAAAMRRWTEPARRVGVAQATADLGPRLSMDRHVTELLTVLRAAAGTTRR